MVYAIDEVLEQSYNKKISKYTGPYDKDRIIPLVIRHNGMVYTKSLEFIQKVIPEVSNAFLSKIACIATVRYEQKAIQANTERIRDMIKE